MSSPSKRSVSLNDDTSRIVIVVATWAAVAAGLLVVLACAWRAESQLRKRKEKEKAKGRRERKKRKKERTTEWNKGKKTHAEKVGGRGAGGVDPGGSSLPRGSSRDVGTDRRDTHFVPLMSGGLLPPGEESMPS